MHGKRRSPRLLRQYIVSLHYHKAGASAFNTKNPLRAPHDAAASQRIGRSGAGEAAPWICLLDSPPRPCTWACRQTCWACKAWNRDCNCPVALAIAAALAIANSTTQVAPCVSVSVSVRALLIFLCSAVAVCCRARPCGIVRTAASGRNRATSRSGYPTPTTGPRVTASGCSPRAARYSSHTLDRTIRPLFCDHIFVLRLLPCDHTLVKMRPLPFAVSSLLVSATARPLPAPPATGAQAVPRHTEPRAHGGRLPDGAIARPGQDVPALDLARRRLRELELRDGTSQYTCPARAREAPRWARRARGHAVPIG